MIGKLKTVMISVLAAGTASVFAQMPTVQVAEVSTLAQTEPKTYVGTIGAMNTVDVMAKISGTLWKASFKEGSMVKAGDLLFEIEDTIYKANAMAAEAVLKQMEAEYQYAQKEYERYQKLYNADATAKTTYENTVRSLKYYLAKIEEAKATLALRKNELSYTKIYSPLNGRIGSNIYSNGNYITPSLGKLTRIVQFDPIKVKFSMSESDFFNHFDRGTLENSTLTISRADGKPFNGNVRLDFIDNQVDSKTGTIMIQLEGDNPKMELIPGGYVTVKLAKKFETPLPAISITAIMSDGKSHYVYVLDKENQVVRRDIVIGNQVRNMQIVTSGLKPGERVIIGGVHKARPGIKVNPATKVETTKALK